MKSPFGPSTAALALLLWATPTIAQAQGLELHLAQAGALLSYGEAEVKILYAALSAKEFDPAITKSVMDELARSFNEGKKRVDRAIPLIEDKDKANEPELLKLRESFKKCEDALTKLSTDIDEQTGAKGDDDDGKHDEEDDDKPQTDWELLKRGTSWVAVDLANVRTLYTGIAKKMKLPNLAAPPKPKGKREE